MKTEAAVLALALAMAGVALNEAGKFQGSMEEIGTLFNGTSEEVKQLEESLKEYAKNSSAAIDEINQATYIAISTGTDWTDVNIALAASEQLAVAGATDLATATGALSRVMNAYGLDAEEARQVSEALFTAVQNGDTTMAALAVNIGKVATTANAASVDLDELLSAIAAITVSGVKTEETMTLLNALFKELASPSKELAEALGDMSLESNSLQEIMQVLQEKTGGTWAEMDKLFSSSEAVKGALVLANDASGTFAKTLEAMEDRSGNLQAAYDAMAETMQRVNQKLVNNVKVTLIDAGIPLLDEYGTAVKALTEIFAGIGDGIKAPNFNKVYGAIEDFVNKMSAKMSDIAEALPEAMAGLEFDDLIQSFEDLAEVVEESLDSVFGDNLDLSKPEDLTVALQKAINIIATFVDLTTGIIKGFGPIFDVLGEAGERLGDTSSDATKATGEVLGAITLIKEFGTALGGSLVLINQTKTEITNVFSTLSGLAKIIINSLQIAFDSFAAIVVKTAETLAGVLEKITFGDLSDEFGKSKDELAQIGDAIRDNLLNNIEDFEEGWERLSDGISGDAAIKKATNNLDELGNKAEETSKPIQDLGETVDEFADAVEVVPSTIPGVSKSMDDMAESTKKADEVQKGIVKTMVDGVPTFKQAGKTTKELADNQDKAREAAEKLQLEFAKLQVDLEKIASNERIKTMEFFVDLEVAKVEADAEKVKSAMESVAQVYAESTDLISNLYGNIGDVSGLDKLHLEQSIRQAEDLAKDQWETQKDLIEAQTKQIEAATRRAQSGGALITVDGGNLQPELEAIMQSLFKTIRIKMSADYENFLLGL